MIIQIGHFYSGYFALIRKVQVLLMTLMMAQFYSSVPESHTGVTVSQCRKLKLLNLILLHFYYIQLHVSY